MQLKGLPTDLSYLMDTEGVAREIQACKPGAFFADLRREAAQIKGALVDTYQ